MNSFMIYFLILLFAKHIKGISEEYYECINPYRKITTHSDCTSMQIPDSVGYKCCSMKVTFENNSFNNCFPLESKYTTSQEVFNEYIFKSNYAFLFGETGGKLEIECPNDMKIIKNYEKLSEEYTSCYNGHMKGVQEENDCTKNELPAKEGGKCCFLESSQINDNGKVIGDKRCYMIQDEYFKKDKNFNDYLLDWSNIQRLDEIVNTNITIKCKNFDTFFFTSKTRDIKPSYNPPLTTPTETTLTETTLIETTTPNDENEDEPLPGKILPKKKEESGIKAWVIILIIIGCILLIGIIFIIIMIYYRKRKSSLEVNKNKNDTTVNSSSDVNKEDFKN